MRVSPEALGDVIRDVWSKQMGDQCGTGGGEDEIVVDERLPYELSVYVLEMFEGLVLVMERLGLDTDPITEESLRGAISAIKNDCRLPRDFRSFGDLLGPLWFPPG